jgi:hypothetical protein
MMMSETLANYGERASEREYLTLAFSPTSAPLRSRWRNNGLSADFLGDYVTTFLPTNGGVPAFENHQNEIKHAVTYIANELLENAMKYHQPDVEIPIRIHLELASDHITVSVSNGISVVQAGRYKAFVEHLQEGDAGDLLLRQQEESAKSSESTMSGLGLLTMISDYDAQLDWRFDVHPTQSESITVTTSAVLPLKNVPGAAA